MTRARILANILAHLEAERFAPVKPQRHRTTLPPVTPEQAERNRQILADALSDDPVVVGWREREAS